MLAVCGLRAVRESWPGPFRERAYVTWGVVAIFTVTAVLGLLSPQNRYLFGPIDYHVRAKHDSVG